MTGPTEPPPAGPPPAEPAAAARPGTAGRAAAADAGTGAPPEPRPAEAAAAPSSDALDALGALDGCAGIELRHLRGFLAVAEERSFTYAAARLRIGQPALTRTVRALETALGVRLLDRTTRRVELTAAGRGLHADLAPLLPRLAAALRAPAQATPLRLGFTSLLPTACTELNARFTAATGTGVRLVRRDAPLAGLESGEADVAVVRGALPRGAAVRTAVLLHEPRVAALARTAAPGPADRGPGGDADAEALRVLARRRVLDWTELAGLPLVVNTVTGSTGPELWPEGRRPRLACTAGNVDEWLEAVAAGHGVGVAPDSLARRHTHPGLRYVRLKNAPPVTVRLAVPARGAHPLAERFLALARPGEEPEPTG
ncbi:LysR family transcriptional regulator [Streptomyces sp. NPDC014733]|uniref:LysR family transcriptional regulator n=1 Tax=Streptomyces sp. NPDC014733 TaxID=3364885 RepID=UPI003701D91D